MPGSFPASLVVFVFQTSAVKLKLVTVRCLKEEQAIKNELRWIFLQLLRRTVEHVAGLAGTQRMRGSGFLISVL